MRAAGCARGGARRRVARVAARRATNRLMPDKAPDAELELCGFREFFLHASGTKINKKMGGERARVQKELLDRELNPGLRRDRAGY